MNIFYIKCELLLSVWLYGNEMEHRVLAEDVQQRIIISTRGRRAKLLLSKKKRSN